VTGRNGCIITRWTVKPEIGTPDSGIGAATMCLSAHEPPFDPVLDLLHSGRILKRLTRHVQPPTGPPLEKPRMRREACKLIGTAR
jgi:hypothetical protein